MLKELHIVEAHNTGFPTILDACDNNDSDYPVFISDDDRSFLTVRLNIHRAFLNENRERRNLEKDILDILEKGSFTLSQLSRSLGYEQITGALKRNLKIMISKGLISYNGKLYNVKK